MMQKNRPRSSSLFLMELILAILFFSIASTVCVQVFVQSHLLSRKYSALNHAVTLCTSEAETISASALQTEEGETITYYDADFSVCDEKDSAYILTVDTKNEDSFLNTHIAMTDTAGELIYELNTTHYIPRRISNEER